LAADRPISAAPAIIFDCDGVLVDSEVIAVEIEMSALAELGIVFDSADYKARFLGATSAAYFAALDQAHRDLHGRPLDPGFENRLIDRRRLAFEDRLEPIPGIARLLAGSSWPRAVGSSASDYGLRRRLSITGLAKYFGGHVYSADLVARGKPAPDLFLHVADRLGRPPADCLVVEDSRNGILAAKAAGMQAIGFIGGAHCDPGDHATLVEAGAAAVIGHMNEFEATFNSLAIGAGAPKS